MDCAFRITIPYAEIGAGFLEGLAELSDTLVIYEHEADEEVSRTHCHGLMLGCKRGQDTIRNKYFKNIYAKQDYSLVAKTLNKVIDKKFITYMSKGKLNPKYCKGVSDIEIAELTALWRDMTTKVVDAETKKKPTNIYEICELIRKDYLDNNRKLLEDYSNSEIIQAIIKYHNKEKKAINAYKVRDYYDCIIMMAKPNRYIDTVGQLIQKRDGYF